MAYDQHLAARVHAILPPDLAVAERKMFGGLAYMVQGNMAAGIVGDVLMVRVGPRVRRRPGPTLHPPHGL